MGSSKIQGQSQGHMTSAFMCFVKAKNNRNTTSHHGLLDMVNRCVYICQL